MANGGLPQVDFDLIKSIGPSFLQGTLTRAKLQELEEERLKRQLEMALAQRKVAGQEALYKMLMGEGQPLTQGGLGGAYQPVQPPAHQGPPQIPPFIRRPGPEYQPQAGEITQKDLMAHLGEEEPQEGQRDDFSDLERSINAFVNQPSQYRRYAAGLAATGDMGEMSSMLGRELDEKKMRIDQVNNAMTQLSEWTKNMSPEEFNKSIPILQGAFPFLRAVSPVTLQRSTEVTFDWLRGPDGSIQAKVIKGGGVTPKAEYARPFDIFMQGDQRTKEEVLQFTEAGATRIDTGQKLDTKLREQAQGIWLQQLPKWEEDARMATMTIQRAGAMKQLLDEGAGGKWGAWTASWGPWLEMVAPDVAKSLDYGKAKTYEVLAQLLTGGKRKDVVGVGPMSNYEQELMIKVKAGGEAGRLAAYELIDYYIKESIPAVERYNDAVGQMPKDLAVGFRPMDYKKYLPKSAPKQTGQQAGPQGQPTRMMGVYQGRMQMLEFINGQWVPVQGRQ